MNNIRALAGLPFFLPILAIAAHSSLENQPCTLAGGEKQSTCIEWISCKFFSSGQFLEQDRSVEFFSDMRNNFLSCGSDFDLICCPDEKNPVTTDPDPSEVTTFEVSMENLEQHPNLHLINRNCGSFPSTRIIKGTETGLQELRWIVALGYKTIKDPEIVTFNCGGALISPSFVLTSAHCTKPSLVKVRLGEHDMSTDPDCDDNDYCLDTVQDFDNFTTVQHPNYDEYVQDGEIDHDIALIRLGTPADLSKNNVKTICLPITQEMQFTEIDEQFRNNMIVAGWGSTETGRISNVLRKASLKYITNKECNRRLAFINSQVTSIHLCASGDDETDAADGDSGGPLQTFSNVKGQMRMTLYGIVDSGFKYEKNEKSYPGIYVHVAVYLKWILDNLSQ